MNTLNVLALVAHVLIAAAIIGLVMLQKGKGADAGAGFGSGASGTVFGARGSANFLSRSTAVMAALFFASSLALAYLNSNRQVATSVLDSTVVEEELEVVEAPPVPVEEDSFELPPLPETEESAEAAEPAAPAEADEELPVVPE